MKKGVTVLNADKIILEAAPNESIKDFILEGIDTSFGSEVPVELHNFNSKTKYIIFNPAPLDTTDGRTISGKVIDPDNAYRRGTAEFEFSFPYNRPNLYDKEKGGSIATEKRSAIDGIAELFNPPHKLFEKRLNTTEEGKKVKKDTNNKIKQEFENYEKISNACMQKLRTIDIKNYEKVLNRFYETMIMTSVHGLSLEDGMELKKLLQDNGYDITSKPCPYTDENDKEQHAKGIIRHMFTGPFNLGELHHNIIHLVENWRKEFNVTNSTVSSTELNKGIVWSIDKAIETLKDCPKGTTIVLCLNGKCDDSIDHAMKEKKMEVTIDSYPTLTYRPGTREHNITINK